MSSFEIDDPTVIPLPAPAPTPNTPDTISLTTANISAKQGEDLKFEIKIAPKSHPVVIEFETLDDTAVAGTDYTAQKSQVTIIAGQVSTKINISTLTTTRLVATKKLKLKVKASAANLSESLEADGEIQPNAAAFKAKQIATGPFSLLSCLITPNDKVKCWGAVKTTFADPASDSAAEYKYPTEVVGLENAKKIAVGSSHVCAIMSDDKVKCWGNNYYGQLGNNVKDQGVSLTPVDVLNVSGVKDIAAGFAHTCIVTATNTVKCWGRNGAREVPYLSTDPGNGNDQFTPVARDVLAAINVKAVSLGWFFSCALLMDGTEKCWGHNVAGQLGNPNALNFGPFIVAGLNNISQIAATALVHNCALTNAGDVYCWGSANGQSSTQIIGPTLITNGIKFLSISAGLNCGITIQNTVACWEPGRPISVITGLNNIELLAAGYAMKSDGTLYQFSAAGNLTVVNY